MKSLLARALVASIALVSLATAASGSPAGAAGETRQVRVSVTSIKVFDDGDNVGCGEFRLTTKLATKKVQTSTADFGNYVGGLNTFGLPEDGAGKKFDVSDLCSDETRSFANGILVLQDKVAPSQAVSWSIKTSEADAFNVHHDAQLPPFSINASTPTTKFVTQEVEWNGSKANHYRLKYTIKIVVSAV